MTFDSQAFLQSRFKGGLETDYPTFTLGVYPGICTKVDARVNTARETGQQFVSLDTTWEIQDDGIREEAKMDHPTVRYSFILNLDENGGIIYEGNQKLARLLEAVGLNQEEWSPQDIKGRPANVSVGHRVNSETGEIFNEAKNIGPLK
jgi:hypothetical protein